MYPLPKINPHDATYFTELIGGWWDENKNFNLHLTQIQSNLRPAWSTLLESGFYESEFYKEGPALENLADAMIVLAGLLERHNIHDWERYPRGKAKTQLSPSDNPAPAEEIASCFTLLTKAGLDYQNSREHWPGYLMDLLVGIMELSDAASLDIDKAIDRKLAYYREGGKSELDSNPYEIFRIANLIASQNATHESTHESTHKEGTLSDYFDKYVHIRPMAGLIPYVHIAVRKGNEFVPVFTGTIDSDGRINVKRFHPGVWTLHLKDLASDLQETSPQESPRVLVEPSLDPTTEFSHISDAEVFSETLILREASSPIESTGLFANMKVLQEKSRAAAEDAGWYKRPRNFGDRIARLHQELSQAGAQYKLRELEVESFSVCECVKSAGSHAADCPAYGIRDNLERGHYLSRHKGVPYELADAMIALLDMVEIHELLLRDQLPRKSFPIFKPITLASGPPWPTTTRTKSSAPHTATLIGAISSPTAPRSSKLWPT